MRHAAIFALVLLGGVASVLWGSHTAYQCWISQPVRWWEGLSL